MAQQDHDIDPFKVSSPRIFLVRMLVFLMLGALLVVILYKQIWTAFLANPGLNALIVLVLLIGIVFAFRQVIRLFPEVAWVNSFRLADPGLAVERSPVLLAPMATILRDRVGRMAMSPQTMRGIMDSIANPPRRGARHLALHDRPAGVPRPARHLLGPDRDGHLGPRRDRGPQGRAAMPARCSMRSRKGSPPRSAAWASRSRPRCSASPVRSSSAFSTCRPARRRTASTPTSRTGSPPRCATSASTRVPARRRAIERRAARRDRAAARDPGRRGGSASRRPRRSSISPKSLQGLIHHMRTEQQMIRDWVDAQAEQHRDIRKLLEILVHETQKMLTHGQRRWRSPHPPRQRPELLARIRRRAVDAGPRHHLPADRLRGGAVLPVAGGRRQGHRAVAAQRR